MLTSTLDAATLENLVSAAVAAPSMHNTQPWRFRFRPETTTLEVRAVPQQALQVTDSAGRGVHISVGAAVFNLRVAVRHLGREPVVHLLPHAAEPDLLAAIRLAGPTHVVAGGDRDLHEAIWHRHSSRLPFTGRPVDRTILAELAAAARAEGAELEIPSEAEVLRLLAVTAEAERRNTTEPRRGAESRHALHAADGGRHGIPATSLGPQDAEGRLPVRDFSAVRPAEHLPTASFEAHPCIVLLSTTHDEAADWLRAGQALEHVLLLATDHGLRASLLHQAMEWPDLRWSLRDPHHGPGHPQMLIRLGHGPEGAATPRSPASDVLDGEPDEPR
ncbi:nitroreductase family protein [Kitasatospora sp. NBC_01287]|uniref:Acg family FMN-binding oxidoreductase n=1 Tax=Kitasatospora sp. NBC_01287 TaxID=2903573 RepID=UPI002253868C|nr:nitroreductase family protein [Kitasatospora sp. NBC_01287]MCX4744758.1 nitroreductase family protein [Kitasatospora sp. NBC_01287]